MALPFRLRVPDQADMNGPEVTTVTHRLHGLARLEEADLVLEWTGTTERNTVKPGGLRTAAVPVPARELRLPATAVVAATLRGGWWRPRLELRLRGLRDAGDLPSAAAGVVTLWLARRDRPAAREFLAGLEFAQADAALREAEGEGGGA